MALLQLKEIPKNPGCMTSIELTILQQKASIQIKKVKP